MTVSNGSRRRFLLEKKMDWKSKKVIVLAVGIVLLIAKAVWPDLAEMNTAELVALISAYLIGQGVADAGKEKAKIEAANEK